MEETKGDESSPQRYEDNTITKTSNNSSSINIDLKFIKNEIENDNN